MCERRWTNDHGDPGLRRKFDVYKPRDGRALPFTAQTYTSYPNSARLGADGEFIFVLRPETDAHAVTALHAYARAVRKRDPQLARDIREQLFRITKENTT